MPSKTKKPKVLFVYAHKYPEKWMDGLQAALKLLEDDFDIEYMNLVEEGRGGTLNFDFILGWGAWGSPVDLYLKDDFQSDKAKRGLCIAGNAIPPENMEMYDVLFYETDWYRPTIETHPNIVKAFGVNTDIYFPSDIPTPVVWDYIGVGAFANWKRWEKMANEREGNRIVIGEVQEGNMDESMEIIRYLLLSGVQVSNMVHPFDLSNMLQWSRTLYMPSDVFGGGERAVWEAKSVGLPVEIENDNQKLLELCNEEPKSHHFYAQQLKKGIESVL